MTKGPESEENADPESTLGRRNFLKGVGKFAILTPPTVTMLLHTSMNSPAVAGSGGKPGWGWGDKKHVHTGPPGQHKKLFKIFSTKKSKDDWRPRSR
jgi:hypothetical protein